MIGNIILYFALRVIYLALPAIPLRLAYRLADIAGAVAYYLFPIPRRAACENLAVVTGLPARSPLVGQLARSTFANDARNWVDTLRIGRLSTQQVIQQIQPVEGWEHLEEAMAAGKGAVMVTLHLGNYDMVGQILVARGHRLTVPVEHMRPHSLYEFLTAQRRSQGINVVPVEQAPRAMLKALRAGEIVGVAGDRGVAGKTLPVQLFGRETRLPAAPVALARKTGAPLLIGIGLRQGDRLVGFISPPIEMVDTGRGIEDDRANLDRLATAMETQIRRFPGQWLMFSRMWTDHSGEDAATIRRTEAAV